MTKADEGMIATEERCVPDWANVVGLMLMFTGVAVLAGLVAVKLGVDVVTCAVGFGGALLFLAGVALLRESNSAKGSGG